MKIIARTMGQNLLLEASQDEIANLFGAYSQYSLEDVGMKPGDIKPGLEIDVKGSYERLYWLQNRGGEFQSLRRACEDALKETERLKPVFRAINGA